jgi:uncharacterized protein
MIGYGVGLRVVHYPYLRRTPPENWGVDFLEAISEDYFYGRNDAILDHVADHRPVTLHGVELNIGGTDPLDDDYLRQLKALAQRVRPAWISDHLCWTGLGSVRTHDLLPLPYTAETLVHVMRRVRQVQDYLGCPILLENPSAYTAWHCSEMSEPEFLDLLATTTGCGILLDVNNVYVSAINQGFAPVSYLMDLSPESIGYLHVAGHTDAHGVLIDTHSQPVEESVWSLYRLAQQLTGGVHVCLERDAEIPPWPDLVTELGRARDWSIALPPDLDVDRDPDRQH